MRVSSLLPILAVFAACANSRAIGNQGATVVSSASLYLRNTFDTDPSIYIGRFIPAGVTDVDESNTLMLACSKHITSRFIEGGGVHFTENLTVSTAVAARIGIPVIADASASHNQSRNARADYNLTGKLVAEIADPAAFAACCKSQPDQCTDRFIGEFVQGTGSLQHGAQRETKIDASGTNPQTGINGAGGLDNSAEWQRVAEFPTPVYFGFKLNPTVFTQNGCPSWANEVPRAEGGFYVVGRSDNSRNEQNARNDALENANVLAMQSAGLAVGSLGGAPMPMRTESWCVTTTPVRRSVRHAARVLAFVSNDDVAGARRAAEAHAAARREEARLQAERAEAARLQAEREVEKMQAEAAANNGPPPANNTTPPSTGPTQPAPASGDAGRIMAAIDAESFSANKVAALDLASKNSRVSAVEARAILDLFPFSADKLSALRILRDKIHDPQNWSALLESFASTRDREEARKLAP